MHDTPLTPTEFVALFNQTLETAWPVVVIEGELSDFRISKNRWVYFDLKDEESSVRFFGTVYNLPGPLEDGLTVRVVGVPRLHQRFGFTINVQSIIPVGEGALKKAAELLRRKLEAEGLFALQRKRALPPVPETIGLITAGASAAYSDFIKIIKERWSGLEIQLIDVYVQGEQAPTQIAVALETFNRRAKIPDVLVITRGGGSLDDLAAFNDERVVRAVAASRAPTIVAIGHEVDVSLAELAADMRASTPSNAATLLTPDKNQELKNNQQVQADLAKRLNTIYEDIVAYAARSLESIMNTIQRLLINEESRLDSARRLAELLNPQAALKRGYAILTVASRQVMRVGQVKVGDELAARVSDGTIQSVVRSLSKNAKTK
ncbi:exodeoxyribonuclease VII large subunit [Candidatus Saccharibacteria bacterium RIFCSPHIGHO2_12_FULL_49_19]|nr:MAG: exodeoxyribonuclease VII large subunit [Candidatus Saccharibacteria bacterium RIFCSPHIGHO2_01_FULL_49_21]OGL36863.1 MAG: exodeoxyribonuclease VII large subunit [Candidatus Saccharibacteria bacterium RIFCSPHIGHO2_12_FULL_49_19]OGL37094.1 MAG: exodeoxyribonuclease VII large subunit [Candidatus Saccharibacteria bacterium RIFCSPLOWO2_01_FULL_49_22]